MTLSHSCKRFSIFFEKFHWKSRINPKKSLSPYRKIKIFPTSVIRMELHAKCHHLYVQCFNDPLIYTIETESAIVIQTIKTTAEEMISLENRNTFTASPCGLLIFTKCPQEDQIKCIRISNQEAIDQFRIPISLTTRKYTVTSLSYHPTKNVIACTIFGDLISSCLFLMYNGTEDTNKQYENAGRFDRDTDLNSNIFEELRRDNRSFDMFNSNENQSEPAFVSILNRIDDLFCMAIQSPKHTNEYDRLNDMHEFLQKFRIESTQSEIFESSVHHGIRSESDIREKEDPFPDKYSDDSVELKIKRNEFESKQSACMSWQETNMLSNGTEQSHSNDSQHTFRIESKAAQNSNIHDDNVNSNATYSISSDVSNPSNRTYEIPK